MGAENNRVSQKEKGMVLYAFLTLSGVSVEEAAEHFLDDYDETALQRVFQILLSYGFNEKSSGRFVKLYTFAFKRSRFFENDINLFKQQDIAAFVQAHPDGGTTPEEMERFLRDRINKRLQEQRSGKPVSSPQNVSQQPEEPQQPLERQQPEPPRQPEKPAYTAPDPVKIPSDKEEPDSSPPVISEKDKKSDKSKESSKKSADASKKKWVKVVGVIIGILALLFIFGSTCGGSAISCVSSSGCVSSRPLNVDINVGYSSNGSFDNATMVVDSQLRSHLDENTINKFSANLSSGKHTICVEYYKNGTLYTTDTLEFEVKKRGELFEWVVYPGGERLILALSNT